MTTKLRAFNVWGTVTVFDSKVVVILVACPDGKAPITRTVSKTYETKLDFEGTAIVSLELTKERGYDLVVAELGKTKVVGHPNVDNVMTEAAQAVRLAVGWQTLNS